MAFGWSWERPASVGLLVSGAETRLFAPGAATENKSISKYAKLLLEAWYRFHLSLLTPESSSKKVYSNSEPRNEMYDRYVNQFEANFNSLSQTGDSELVKELIKSLGRIDGTWVICDFGRVDFLTEVRHAQPS